MKSVLVHRPGSEMSALVDPDSVQMLAIPDIMIASEQHDALANAYKAEGVKVHYVDSDGVPSPNQMFVADLMFTSPEGAIIARPASTVRAGEERLRWLGGSLSWVYLS